MISKFWTFIPPLLFIIMTTGASHFFNLRWGVALLEAVAYLLGIVYSGLCRMAEPPR